MPKQANSFIIPDDIIKDMKDRIKDTSKAKIEFGFALCKNKDDNIIKKGTECTGEKCSIRIGMCKKDLIHIGNYHTHPRSHPTMSITDMISGCSEDIECIGSVPFNNIRCFTRKTKDKDQCIKDISPFKLEEYEILEKREKIRSTLKSPKILIRTNILKLLKGISQYETQVAKYNSNRFKLLNKHFNRIDI